MRDDKAYELKRWFARIKRLGGHNVYISRDDLALMNSSDMFHGAINWMRATKVDDPAGKYNGLKIYIDCNL